MISHKDFFVLIVIHPNLISSLSKKKYFRQNQQLTKQSFKQTVDDQTTIFMTRA